MKSVRIFLFLLLPTLCFAGIYEPGPGTYTLSLVSNPQTYQPTTEDISWKKRFMKRCRVTEEEMLKKGTIRFFGLTQHQCVYSFQNKKINIPVFADVEHPDELITFHVDEKGHIDEETYFYINFKDKVVADAWVGTYLRKRKGPLVLYLFDSARRPNGFLVDDYPGEKMIFKDKKVTWN